MSTDKTTAAYGWTSVPRDPKLILSGNEYLHEPRSLFVQDIPFPSDDELVVKVQKYAQEKLTGQTYNHSMRVYYFGELSCCQDKAVTDGSCKPWPFSSSNSPSRPRLCPCRH